MKKQISLVVASLIILATVLSGVSLIKQKEETTKLRVVRIAYNPESTSHAAIMIDSEEKIFEKHRLTPKLVPLSSGSESRQALASGQVDIAIGGMTNFFSSIAKKAPMKVLGGGAESGIYVLVRPNDISTISQLSGKKVAVNQTGLSGLGFRSVLSKEGVDPNGISSIDIDDPYLSTSLMTTKTVDAIVASAQEVDRVLQTGAVVLPEWSEKNLFSKKMPRSSIIVNTDFLNKNKEMVSDFLDSYIESVEFIDNYPEKAANILSVYIKRETAGAIDITPVSIKKEWDDGMLNNYLWKDPGSFKTLLDASYEIKLIKEKLTVDQVFDRTFEEKLKNAQRKLDKK